MAGDLIGEAAMRAKYDLGHMTPDARIAASSRWLSPSLCLRYSVFNI